MKTLLEFDSPQIYCDMDGVLADFDNGGKNMILRANKGIIFNMLQAPYPDTKYEAYYPERIEQELSLIDHSKIEIIEGYMGNDAEFTVYFYV